MKLTVITFLLIRILPIMCFSGMNCPCMVGEDCTIHGFYPHPLILIITLWNKFNWKMADTSSNPSLISDQVGTLHHNSFLCTLFIRSPLVFYPENHTASCFEAPGAYPDSYPGIGNAKWYVFKNLESKRWKEYDERRRSTRSCSNWPVHDQQLLTGQFLGHESL